MTSASSAARYPASRSPFARTARWSASTCEAPRSRRDIPTRESDGFGDGGFLTGDYGAWDAGGRLTLRGRVSSFVNVAGRKVHPDEVEHVLRDMPGITHVRVVAAPDAKRGQQIVACIVANGAGDHGADGPAVLRRASRAAQDS